MRLAWRPSLGDGTFGEERALVDHEFLGGISGIDPTDFDLDGTTDLFLRPSSSSEALYVSVRNDGRGNGEVVWTSDTGAN